MDKHILVNAIRTPDGTVLHSKHRHDYVEYQDTNGVIYAVDGGTAYLRRVGGDGYVEMSLYEGDPHYKIRYMFCWGSYGKYGNEPLHWVVLKDMTDEHINAILRTQNPLPHIWKLFRDELKWRIDNG